MDRIMKNQAGVTLIELCISMVIISFTALIICTFSKSTSTMNKNALCNDAAYLAAEQKIVTLKSEVFNEMPVKSSDNITLENINFTRDWTIDTDQSGYFLLATVTVSWNSSTGTKQITLAGTVN